MALENNRYLIIEDDFEDVEFIKKNIEKLGYEPYFFLLSKEDVEEIIEAFEWNKINLPSVIQLDGLGGECFSFARTLKKANPQSKIILYSFADYYVEKAEADPNFDRAFKKDYKSSFKDSSLGKYLKSLI